MTRPATPTPEQLDHLIGTADRRQLTPTEAALLRAGVHQLRARLAGIGAAHRAAPSRAYLGQLKQQAAPTATKPAPSCARCHDLRIVPDWSRWNTAHGEPHPKPCPDCTSN